RRQRHEQPAKRSGTPPDAKPSAARGFGRLLWQFLGLLRGHGWAIGFALTTLTFATVLRLIPPLATKIVIDNVLTDHPLPSWWVSSFGLPTDPYLLLYWIGGAV